jgi:hypothetical protein
MLTEKPMSKLEDTQSDHTEYIVELPGGDFLCICGNTPWNAGFYPINEKNEEVEPTLKDWTTNLYACFQCGRIIDQSSLAVVRRVALDSIKTLD